MSYEPRTYPPPWIKYRHGSGPSMPFGRCTRTTTCGSSLTTWSVRSTASESSTAANISPRALRIAGSTSADSVKPTGAAARAGAISSSRMTASMRGTYHHPPALYRVTENMQRERRLRSHTGFADRTTSEGANDDQADVWSASLESGSGSSPARAPVPQRPPLARPPRPQPPARLTGHVGPGGIEPPTEGL